MTERFGKRSGGQSGNPIKLWCKFSYFVVFFIYSYIFNNKIIYKLLYKLLCSFKASPGISVGSGQFSPICFIFIYFLFIWGQIISVYLFFVNVSAFIFTSSCFFLLRRPFAPFSTWRGALASGLWGLFFYCTVWVQMSSDQTRTAKESRCFYSRDKSSLPFLTSLLIGINTRDWTQTEP